MRFARRTHRAKRAMLSPFCRTRAAGSDIHLTFDDGPHPDYTPAVLDRLAAFGLKATFFLVGNRTTDPGLVDRIRTAGHTLGNHTFAHELPRWRKLNAMSDLRRCQELIPGATRFRAPLGRLTPGLWLAARRLGLECMGWTLDSGDWRCRTESEARVCAKEVLELVRPGDIVLFHDDHRWIGPILDVVLPGLHAAPFHIERQRKSTDDQMIYALPSTRSTTQHPRTWTASSARQ